MLMLYIFIFFLGYRKFQDRVIYFFAENKYSQNETEFSVQEWAGEMKSSQQCFIDGHLKCLLSTKEQYSTYTSASFDWSP